MINNLSDSEIRKLRQLLRSIPCNGITTYTAGDGITITDTNCCHVKEINFSGVENVHPVDVSGTSLYSTSPATSGFSTSNGIFLGSLAGYQASGAYSSNFLGLNAGRNATNSWGANFFGEVAGYQATESRLSNYIGKFAGYQASNARVSNFIGYGAGYQSTNAQQANFIGWSAGGEAPNTTFSNFMGREAGFSADNATASNFFGAYAGRFADNASNSNFIGYGSGQGAVSASYSNFIGVGAGAYSSGNNVNAFGANAGIGNTISGMTIFSNSSLPSYADRSAATTAITIANGAVAGNTYLYYNQTTFAIEGVRL